ncbi:MAG: hypothetical protein IPK19_10730 [Chloroflexi bacterium]|nr:hypothetical protein [Chloroflexota bacterium]
MSQWIASSDQRVAWLSLNEDDGDFTRFLTYLVAALRTVVPPVGDAAVRLLQSERAPQRDSLLTLLLNDIAAIPHKLVLVLDDYHAVNGREIDSALAFLLAHLPPQMHLVIATREDPQLPLASLRARAQLNELRITDLRFNFEEAAEFLRHMMGLNLSAEDIAALESRTEGWIAGLQMAALSMQGADRHWCVHPSLHRQPSFCTGLPCRRSLTATVGKRSDLSAPYVDSRPPLRFAVRCSDVRRFRSWSSDDRGD